MTTQYEIHPAAKLFPPLSDEEFSQLVDSIRQNGQREAIWLDKENRIIDGRNRYRACRELGVEIKTRVFEGDEITLFVVDQNLHRRHLTASQKAIVALDLERALAREARERQGTRTDLGATLEPVPRSRDMAGKMVGVAPRYVSDAKLIAREDTVLLDEIRCGEKTLTEAKRELNARRYNAEREANRAKIQVADKPEELVGTFSTIVIDPPWDYSEETTEDDEFRTKVRYNSLSTDDIAALPVGARAAQNAHLYLWITNRALITGKGARICETWGFVPKTVLTWCKPSFGIGYYFRHSTEHVIFAMRGKLPIQARNIGTWFQAPRGPYGHSSKPEEIYALVERASPGPYLEWFGRHDRAPRHWTVFGEDGVRKAEYSEEQEAMDV